MNRPDDPPISPPGNTPDPESTRAQGARDADLTARLVPLLDAYLAELEAGRTPDRARLIADHPELATAIEEALAGLEFIHRTGTREVEPPVQLGDFRIVREIGRGGMGVVYEAEQLSLKRRVALKVLRFGPLVDEVAQQRFQREAETVGRLHHTNIVPIFAVGAEQGVRYYAMQYIEGRDLGRIAQTARETAQPLGFREVADWGLQAADALWHAHQRGVIHRDIKPSNLILDGEGRIWLTDFGLARRLDDVSLSLTGALLGTPRYMSPEQAAAASRPVDHRTDIYSLGATLYELLTGRPIFEAASPHEVLSQILHAEPRAPRQVAPSLPRDLETLVLKCLAKEPGRRYDTAHALAEDLRAFAAGRPILARRPRATERVARWFRRNRRLATVGAVSAGIALALTAAAVTGWQSYRDARRGHVRLSSSDPSLLAEILDAQDRIVVPRFAVPNEKPLALPAGSYRMRLLAPGVPSQSWPLDLAPREHRQPNVALTPEWLWPPREIPTRPGQVELVPGRGTTDLLTLLPGESNPDGTPGPMRLRLLGGLDGKPAWPRDLAFDANHCPPGREAAEWSYFAGYTGVVPGFGAGGLAERTADLNADGAGDFVLVSRSSPSLLAVSGADGQLLWWHRGHPPIPENPTPTGVWSSQLGQGFVVGEPARSADLDGDGVPDFVACFRSNGEVLTTGPDTATRVPGRSWLGAVSGRDGRGLWARIVAEDWSQYAASSSAADRFRPLARPQLRRIDGRDVVLLVEQGRLAARDARTGEPAGNPSNPGFALERAPEIADLDGDGRPEAIAIRRREDNDARFELVAFDLPSGTPRWRRDVLSAPSHQAREIESALPHLVRSTDLDADGHPEIVVFAERRLDGDRWWFGLETLDGSTGRLRWEHALFVGDLPQHLPGLVRFLPGDDLDGDGQREVFATIPAYDPDRKVHGIRAFALSGESGTPLWQRHHAGVGGVRALVRGPVGVDGRPMLLVSGPSAGSDPESSLMLDAGSGQAAHILLGVAEPRVADFDGDGLDDLYYPLPGAGGQRLAVWKGLPPEAWRHLDEWTAGPDADGDGLDDLVGCEGESLVARSGRDGRRLWSAPADLANPRAVYVARGAELGGAATNPPAAVFAAVDVKPAKGSANAGLLRSLAAFEARDGRPLWTADDLDIGGGNRSGSTLGWSYEYPAVVFADLDRDRRPEILVARVAGGWHPELVVLNGTDGRVRWSTPVVDGALVGDPDPDGPPLADFDRDGVLDLALIVPPAGTNGAAASCRVNVLEGRTGRPLWPEPFVLAPDPRNLAWPEPILGDLDGDRVPEIAVLRHGGYNAPRGGYVGELIVLDGRDGQIRWVWSWVAGFPEVWAPVILARPAGAAGTPLLCLGLVEHGRVTLVALDAAGTVVVRRPLDASGGPPHGGNLAWRAADLDGDGATELVYPDTGAICVASGPDLGVRWRWKIPAPAEGFRVLPPAATAPGQPVTLVVWAGRDVFGLEGARGHPLWRGRAPTQPMWGNSGEPDLRLVRRGPHPELPALQFTPRLGSANASVVRAAWPTDRDGRYAPRQP